METIESDLFLEASFLVLRAIPAAQRALRAHLARAGHGTVSVPQYRVLVQLLETPSQSLKQLAEREGVEPATMSRTVDGLVSKGWVGRRASSEDRRSIVLEVTNEGGQLVDRLRTQLGQILREHFQSWTDANLRALMHGLSLLESSPLPFPLDQTKESFS